MCQTVTINSCDQGGNKEYWDSGPQTNRFKQCFFSVLLFQIQVTFLQMQSSQQLKLLDQSMMQVVCQSHFFFCADWLSLYFFSAFSSLFKSTIFRQGSSISHWLESKGVLHKLWLDDKKKIKLKICIINVENFVWGLLNPRSCCLTIFWIRTCKKINFSIKKSKIAK